METELQQIQNRNKRVELDKAWETSKTRRGLVALMTYVIAAAFMFKIGASNPLLGALLPAGGYLISTLSLPVVKQWWISKYGNEIH